MSETSRWSDEVVEHARLTRRHPRPTQFDYLHVRRLLEDLTSVLPHIAPPGSRILDVFCGSRPYEDLLPAGSTVVGLDVTEEYGTADIVTTEFLPGPDAEYDAVVCFEGFHYVPDPPAGVDELRRVLRPGGKLVVTVPLVWEYDRGTLEHRYTGPALQRLFADWDDVAVVENGTVVTSWCLLTGRLLDRAEGAATRRGVPARVARGVFGAGLLAMNAAGLRLDRAARRRDAPLVLPPNLMLTARKPARP